MSDFDPKSIPILDDIIDNENDAVASDKAAEVEPVSNHLADIENNPDQDAPDLFNSTTTNDNISDHELNHQKPDKLTAENDFSEDETIESALIDNQQDNIAEAQLPQPNHSQIDLDAVVNDVVKQLIPDLEQQLRFLVKQALEEKLPENNIQLKTVVNDKESTDEH